MAIGIAANTGKRSNRDKTPRPASPSSAPQATSKNPKGCGSPTESASSLASARTYPRADDRPHKNSRPGNWCNRTLHAVRVQPT